ncbi:hypothetical protein [Porphyromonas endodontalis]|jgi:hypothetical protein|uniref:hypothetical protein n=1 Tax=Porphyromonas endodontalis TaxID=28124 RepID=UPI0028EC1DC0|nr:hypothetical protein [Porphyromonas endodontalis]
MRYKYIYYSFLALSLSLLVIPAHAQQEERAVGVGTRTPYSSALDLDVSHLPDGKKKGFLLPKVALMGKSDTHTISNPKKAMMVYNTQDAGSGDQQVYANLVYVWTGQEWVPFSNLPEIRKLKKPIHFVLASKRKINIEISKFNNSQGMPLKWNTDEVYLKNEKDVKVSTISPFEDIEILTEAYYEFTGSFNFKSNADGATSVVVLLQKKTKYGTSWSTIASSSLPFDRGVQAWSQTLVFPVVTHKFKEGDKIRIILKKGEGANQKSGARIAYDPVNEGDVTMNIRLTRLRNEGETYD